jgi:hypothetical protein
MLKKKKELRMTKQSRPRRERRKKSLVASAAAKIPTGLKEACQPACL